LTPALNPDELKILIADDHGVLRSGVIQILKSSFPNAEFGEAADAGETINSVHKSRWDVIILDINLPDRNGIEVLKEIKKNDSAAKVLVFSMYPEDQFAIRSIQAGASAYLTKEISEENFTEAIRKVVSGEQYYTPAIVDLLTSKLREDNKMASHDLLSDREYEVFLLIASGYAVSEIAKKLLLSVKTVCVYRSHILKKMNLKHNAEITHYAFKNNLVK
jgi:two-component system, NarL family, invasion response regulator UvrY